MKQVLDVGQCGADHFAIRQLLEQSFGADVQRAHSQTEALELVQAGHFDLVLVNRVFDADGAAGLDLIRALQSGSQPVPVMLVSNFAEAQKQAVASGAKLGFGKAELHSLATLEKLAQVLGPAARP